MAELRPELGRRVAKRYGVESCAILVMAPHPR